MTEQTVDDIVEGEEAAAKLTKLYPNVAVEAIEDTHRGWQITFQSTRQVWFLLIPLWTETRRYCLTYQVWPGGGAGVAYALTGGASQRPNLNRATFNISLYPVNDEGQVIEKNQLFRVHVFEEAMTRLKRVA